jgi:hypothetical protein
MGKVLSMRFGFCENNKPASEKITSSLEGSNPLELFIVMYLILKEMIAKVNEG